MVIFERDCDKIIFSDGKYFLGLEDGGHMNRYWEFEITKEDAEKVMKDPMYAGKLFNDYKNKLWGLT